MTFPKSVNAHVMVLFITDDSTREDAGVDVGIPFHLVGHDLFKKILEGLTVEILPDPLWNGDITVADVFVPLGTVVVEVVFEVTQPDL